MIAADRIKQYQVRVDDTWVDVQFGQLEPGDHFRCRNRDGSASFEGIADGHPTIKARFIPSNQADATA